MSCVRRKQKTPTRKTFTLSLTTKYLKDFCLSKMFIICKLQKNEEAIGEEKLM